MATSSNAIVGVIKEESQKNLKVDPRRRGSNLLLLRLAFHSKRGTATDRTVQSKTRLRQTPLPETPPQDIEICRGVTNRE
jgi:hypothetical protein